MDVVVDTNVPMVASGHHPGADLACRSACVRQLAAIMREGGLLIDDSGYILREYTANLGFSGQPGAGEVFARWAHSNQAVASVVRRVPIQRCRGSGWRQYEEFPDRPELAAFDRSDQKFVAVAVASGTRPPILNAVDSDWWIHRRGLEAAGVMVEFLCPQHARPR